MMPKPEQEKNKEAFLSLLFSSSILPDRFVMVELLVVWAIVV